MDKIAQFVQLATMGDASALYKLSPVWHWEYKEIDVKYVIVSAVAHAFDHGGAETLVFPARADGSIINMLDIGGGRGYVDHRKALETMGYEYIPVRG